MERWRRWPLPVGQQAAGVSLAAAAVTTTPTSPVFAACNGKDVF
jgi:hypothetical protein